MGPKSTRCTPCSRAHHHNRTYGLSREDYADLMESQSGCCAICFEESNALCVDHDHDTQAVRGLLCSQCNSGIGLLKDSISNLANAIIYLTQ